MTDPDRNLDRNQDQNQDQNPRHDPNDTAASLSTGTGTSTRSQGLTSVRRAGNSPWMVFALLLVVAGAFAAFHASLDVASSVRAAIVVLLAGGLLLGSYRAYFPQRADNVEVAVKKVIAFDAIAFITIGLAAMAMTTPHWATGLLLAGACLLIGGFFGLLFGYPQKAAAAQQVERSGTDPRTAATPGTPGRRDNLVAESAATLGKVIAGFTLAKLSTLTERYSHLCHVLGPGLAGAESTGPILAGVIMAYFLATGFLAGLLLPAYFLSDNF